MKICPTDRILLEQLARIDALARVANLHHGANHEFFAMQAGRGIAWHPAAGSDRRDQERIVEEAVKAGLLKPSGGRTASRRLAMTPMGGFRAAAWLGGSLRETLDLLALVDQIGQTEAGSATVDPSGLVPSFRLGPDMGSRWWDHSDAEKATAAATDVYYALLPAVACGWTTLYFQGNNEASLHWWKLTDAGRAALQGNPDMTPIKKAVASIHKACCTEVADEFIETRKREESTAQELKPHNKNTLPVIGLCISRWWTPKGGRQ